MIEPLVVLLTARNILFLPIVLEEEVPTFEAFAKKHYAIDPELAHLKGIADYGIFATNEFGKFHCNTSDVPFETKYHFLTPVLQYGRVQESIGATLANPRYDQTRGVVQDQVADCFYGIVEADDGGGGGCAALTGVTNPLLISANPNSIFFYPISPDMNRTVLSGFIGVVVDWAVILDEMVPNNNAISGFKLYLELHSPDETFTFTVDSEDGIKYIGPGSLHDTEYNNYVREARI
jgi:hypothetical protein